jgi:hypothetical protein
MEIIINKQISNIRLALTSLGIVLVIVLFVVSSVPATGAQTGISGQAFVMGSPSHPAYVSPLFSTGYSGEAAVRNGLYELQYTANLLAPQNSISSIEVLTDAGEIVEYFNGTGYYAHGIFNFSFFGTDHYVIELFYSPSSSMRETLQASITVINPDEATYIVTFTETGLPNSSLSSTNAWYVTVQENGVWKGMVSSVMDPSPGYDLQMSLTNGTYHFSSGMVVLTNHEPFNGTFIVNGQSDHVLVEFEGV